jgi:hypothetical protein
MEKNKKNTMGGGTKRRPNFSIPGVQLTENVIRDSILVVLENYFTVIFIGCEVQFPNREGQVSNKERDHNCHSIHGSQK